MSPGNRKKSLQKTTTSQNVELREFQWIHLQTTPPKAPGMLWKGQKDGKSQRIRVFAVEPVSPRDVRSFPVKSIPMRQVDLEAGTSALTRLD